MKTPTLDGKPCPFNHITFTHLDLRDGSQIVLSVTRLAELIYGCKGDCPGIALRTIPVADDHAKHVKEHSGIEQHRLDRLTEKDLDGPLIGVEWEDHTHTIVDGNHRFVKAHELGKETMLVFVAQPEVWKKAVIEGFPEIPGATTEEKDQNLRNSYSGL